MLPDFSSTFKPPIFYNAGKKQLQSHIIKDLELLENAETEANNKPIYNFLLTEEKSDNVFSPASIKQLSEYFTTDTVFLKDSQTLLKTLKINNPLQSNCNEMVELWKQVKGDLSFKDKYFYLGWESLEFLNKNEMFLQFMSIYNLASPLISLLMPIIVLIVPFVMLKIQRLPITIHDYIEVLKTLIGNHAVGKLFTKFHSVDMNEKIYILVSCAFYLFSIYQNITTCVKFYTNMKQIDVFFQQLELFLTASSKKMDAFLSFSESLTSFRDFNTDVHKHKFVLEKLLQEIKSINDLCTQTSNSVQSVYNRFTEIGKSLKVFYNFYCDVEINEAMLYAFGFEGYLSCILSIQDNLQSKKVQLTKFLTKKERKYAKIKNNYYAVLKDSNPVKSDISFDKNMIITGPNASGKTTVLKSVLLNVIFSQQFGVGFFESAKLCPFDFVHCYLNIPDTSGRDSLFQAEARRCKEIIDVVNNNENDTHFCVFDELYSGTNPDEAVSSATAFMQYLLKKTNVSCMLTTHFVKVCKNLKKNKRILNFHMVTKRIGGTKKLEYLYKLEEGISQVKGGFNVLSDMNYPKEILEEAKN